MRGFLPLFLAVMVGYGCTDSFDPTRPMSDLEANPAVFQLFSFSDTTTPFVGDTCRWYAPIIYGRIATAGQQTAYYNTDSLAVNQWVSTTLYDASGEEFETALGISPPGVRDGCAYEITYKKMTYSRVGLSPSPTYFNLETSSSSKNFVYFDGVSFRYDSLPTEIRFTHKLTLKHRPVVANLTGPNQISQGGTYTWTAGKLFGASPYTYSWERAPTYWGPWTSICSNSSTCQQTVQYSDSSFHIRVTVEDADQRSGTPGFQVTVNIPAPPAVSTYINGPGVVPEQEDDCKVWTAGVIGGTSPFTYSWSGLASGSSSSISFQPSNSGWLYLTVTDDEDQTDNDSFWIEVDEEGEECTDW